MVPILKKSEIVCPNCVWSIKLDEFRYRCGMTDDTHNAYYYCSWGSFPCEIDGHLKVLDFHDAMSQLGGVGKC